MTGFSSLRYFRAVAQEVLEELPHLLRTRFDDRQFAYLYPGPGLFDTDGQIRDDLLNKGVSATGEKGSGLVVTLE